MTLTQGRLLHPKVLYLMLSQCHWRTVDGDEHHLREFPLLGMLYYSIVPLDEAMTPNRAYEIYQSKANFIPWHQVYGILRPGMFSQASPGLTKLYSTLGAPRHHSLYVSRNGTFLSPLKN